ncbi:hypothetical protein DAEQUDRAFT_254197 [Daedalea quercina L-15889]|uniref:Uncharacterized protein n=1 Tax=Daedalea quercina L-15889 TaxID=1314783 RepID=A0A165QHY0_9APHY|nr:hypothetical protein DAEQUDRAFT_254197 [Daedalea quercina L-15889]
MDLHGATVRTTKMIVQRNLNELQSGEEFSVSTTEIMSALTQGRDDRNLHARDRLTVVARR